MLDAANRISCSSYQYVVVVMIDEIHCRGMG